MGMFFLIVGSTAALFLFFVGAGASLGLSIVCGLSFVAAAIVRLAESVERLSEAKAPSLSKGQPWSVPDKPLKEDML